MTELSNKHCCRPLNLDKYRSTIGVYAEVNILYRYQHSSEFSYMPKKYLYFTVYNHFFDYYLIFNHLLLEISTPLYINYFLTSSSCRQGYLLYNRFSSQEVTSNFPATYYRL